VATGSHSVLVLARRRLATAAFFCLVRQAGSTQRLLEPPLNALSYQLISLRSCRELDELSWARAS